MNHYCEECGEEFYRVEYNSQDFCSGECAEVHLNSEAYDEAYWSGAPAF